MAYDNKGPVVANTAYCDGTKIGRDVSFTLPEIVFQKAEISAMGKMSVPLLGLVENMELSIKKTGLDENFAKVNMLSKHRFEFRWVQSAMTGDGTMRMEGCKAFVNTLPSSVAGFSIEPGSATEAEYKFTVTRIQIFVNGKESILVDRLNNILKVAGINYSKNINNLL